MLRLVERFRHLDGRFLIASRRKHGGVKLQPIRTNGLRSVSMNNPWYIYMYVYDPFFHLNLIANHTISYLPVSL